MEKLFEYLAVILAALSVYNCIIAPLLDFRSPPQKAKPETNTESPSRKKISTVLQLFAILILVLLTFWAPFANPNIAMLFAIPGALLYIFTILFAAKTVGEIAVSKGIDQLTDDENNSLNIIGLLLAFVSTRLFKVIRAAYTNINSVAETLFSTLF